MNHPPERRCFRGFFFDPDSGTLSAMNRVIQIVRADVMGYCMGVRRAVQAAEEALLETPLRPVYTYGPLIHNPTALERLEKAGVVVIGEGYEAVPEDFDGKTVILRAHGIPPAERQELKRRRANIVDATCPRVISSQKRAKKYSDDGFFVFLAGDKAHGEMTSVSGYAPDSVIFQNADEVEQYSAWPEKAVLLCQTTMKQSEYDAIAAALAHHVASLSVLKTICPATKERQQALAELAKQVDGIIVIGGKNSANTIRLYLSAKALCPNAWHIETENDIPQEARSLERIGLTAGASTPDDVIDAVEKALQKE